MRGGRTNQNTLSRFEGNVSLLDVGRLSWLTPVGFHRV